MHLERDPRLQKEALRLLETWLSREDLAGCHKHLRRWRELLLTKSVPEIRQCVFGADRDLLQCSPLAVAISPRERFEVLASLHG